MSVNDVKKNLLQRYGTYDTSFVKYIDILIVALKHCKTSCRFSPVKCKAGQENTEDNGQ